MARTYLLLGGNIGDRAMFLNMARHKIADLIGNVASASSVFETQPWGFVHETAFMNQLIVAETLLEPDQVMQTILKIEQQLGRVRGEKQFIARKVDIDILLYDNRIIHEKDLIIPHPFLEKRRFALEPLAEIEPGLVHPVLKKTIARLLKECDDKLWVQKIENQHLPEI